MIQAPVPAPGLTPDQQKGADAFYAFLMSDAQIFVLSGAAGVGKTFLMSHIVKKVLKDYENMCEILGIPAWIEEVGFTATTHKAAEVLEQSLGRPVQTIHSYAGLQVRNDFKTGKTFVSKKNNWKAMPKRLVFIDECSMVDRPLYKILLETFTDSKIVFVGDHAQLAPVGEKRSVVFDEVAPENFVFLSQPVRNAGSPALMALCSQFRDTVETGVFHPIQEVPGSIDYLDDAGLLTLLEDAFVAQNADIRSLCYTNTRVKDYNADIRILAGLPPEIQIGDQVVTAATSSILGSKEMVGVERQLTILDISTEEISLGYGELFDDGIDIAYREVTVEQFKGFSFKLALPVDQQRWDLAVKYFANIKEWRTHFELKELGADVRHNSAGTVDKSQGSTHDFVLIDLGNIGTSHDANQVARMLYVAVSRPRSRIYLYGRLPARYRGSV